MRYLITGGAGFIGSHLSEKLLALGETVAIIDDLSTGSMDNIAHLKGNGRFRYHLDTIFNRALMTELVDEADVVFHLAAAVGVKRIVDHPVMTLETNVRGTETVLDLAAKKLKRVLITSTSEVYGKSTSFPFSETDDLVLGPTTHSRWGYACSKAIDEFLALAYFREKHLPVTIVRLFNTTGPRQTGRYGMVLPSFVKQALANEPLTVYGTGKQSRCFGHVSDVVEGLVACVQSTKTPGEIFNLGNNQEVSIEQLAETVIKLTNSKSKIEHVPYDQAYGPGFEDMERRVPNIAKAQKVFGYAPKHNLEDIIYSVVEHQRGMSTAGAQAVSR